MEKIQQQWKRLRKDQGLTKKINGGHTWRPSVKYMYDSIAKEKK